MRAVLFLFVFVLAAFCFEIEDIAKNIKKDEIYGEFNQSKSIKGFKKPIISRGKFAITSGVFEQNITSPIQTSVKVGKDGIFELTKDGYKHIDALFDKELFLNIITFNVDALKRNFDYNLSGDSSNWSINLIPKGVISKVFSTIIIKGDRYIKSLSLNEVGGDVSLYEFYDIR